MNEELPKAKTVFHMSNRMYDILKFIALVALPAIGTLYFALGTIWGWESLEQVMGTILALGVFLGSILGLSNNAHKKELINRPDSKLIVDQDGAAYAEFNVDPKTLSPGDKVDLTVIRPPQN